MARLQQAGDRLPARPLVDLERMVWRLQQTLLLPNSDEEVKLRRSRYEREKAGYNLEYARALLLRLEQDAQAIKIQPRKREVQKGLVEKGALLQRLRDRLQELSELGDPEDVESSEGEDILGELTPSDTTDEQTTPTDHSTPELCASPSNAAVPPQTFSPSAPPTSTQAQLRSRNARTDLFSSYTTSTAYSSPPISTATAETLLTHNRTEQETLTDSLLSMATALKDSSKAFASSLNDEKSVLDGTVEGMDNNESGLQAAQKKMGLLRRYSEGKGWWGRILMYIWIGALWVILLLLVFTLPKLRF